MRGVAADVASATGCDLLAQASAGVDILVNNFGIFDPQPFEAIDDAAVAALFRRQRDERRAPDARAACPPCRRAGRGRVVFINSESGVNPPPKWCITA